MSEFGEALGRYRDEAGLNQRELGAAIGLDSTQVNKIERGHRPPLGAKYMKPLVRVLHLNQNQALSLVQLAGHSPKVLEFPDEAVTPLHPGIPRKENAQPDIHARRVPLDDSVAGKIPTTKKAAGHGRALKSGIHAKPTPMPSIAHSAMALPDSLYGSTGEEIDRLIASAGLSEEQEGRMSVKLIEITKHLLELIKPQHEK